MPPVDLGYDGQNSSRDSVTKFGAAPLRRCYPCAVVPAHGVGDGEPVRAYPACFAFRVVAAFRWRNRVRATDFASSYSTAFRWWRKCQPLSGIPDSADDFPFELLRQTA